MADSADFKSRTDLIIITRMRSDNTRTQYEFDPLNKKNDLR